MDIRPTPDAICLSLGLESFEADLSRRTPRQELRLLICPTFDPEVCLTFLAGPRDIEVQAVSARSIIGSRAGEELAEIDQAGGRFTAPALAELGGAFRSALGGELDGVARDGAVIYIAWRDWLVRLKLEFANPAPDAPLAILTAQLIQLALDVLPEGPCRARIADAGRYFGIKPPSGG